MTTPRLQFDPEWRTTLFTLVLLSLMVFLGFWQIQRAGEKTGLAAAWDERQSRDPAPLFEVWDEPAAALTYLPVVATGEFLADEYFLLDNRIVGGRFGYEVLGVMRLEGSDRLVLVNRGWVAGDPARLELPAVPPVSGKVELTGHIYVAPGTPYLLAEQILEPGWPKLLQAVEMDKILPALGPLGSGDVFPYSVRLAAGQPAALTVDWQIVNVSPDKHRAYAAQWFTMALVLAIFYLLRSSNLWQVVKSIGREQS